MKFYILTSRDINALQKHSDTIPRADQVVIINSQDPEYVSKAEWYCKVYSVEYYITESDGTPATGKNSVMKCFLESSNEYMVQIDGDDELTEYGYNFYKNIAQCKNPPDLITLKNQYGKRGHGWIVNDGEVRPHRHARIKPWTRDRKTSEHFKDVNAIVETWKRQRWIDKNGEMYKVWENESDEQLFKWAEGRKKMEQWHWSIAEGNLEIRDIFSRMVFYSRKAAEKAYFTPELLIGEDTVCWYEMKYLSKIGELNVFCHDEEIDYTYIYNDTQYGTVQSNSSKQEKPSWQWPTTLMDYVEKRGMIEKYQCIVDYFLPEITEEYYETDRK